MRTDEKILDAMRSGEWLRTQWIARVAFDLGAAPGPHPEYGRTRRVLDRLGAAGRVERRDATETRTGSIGPAVVSFPIPRDEWRRPLENGTSLEPETAPRDTKTPPNAGLS